METEFTQELAGQLIANMAGTAPAPTELESPEGTEQSAPKTSSDYEKLADQIVEDYSAKINPDIRLDLPSGLTGKHITELRFTTANTGANQLAAYARIGKVWPELKEWESIPNRPSKNVYKGFIEVLPKPWCPPRYSAMGGLFSHPDYVAYLHELHKFHAAHYGRLKPFKGPLEVAVVFYVPKPVKKCRKARYADTKPDLDNLCKAFIDGCDFLQGAENRLRAKARKKAGEAVKFLGGDPRKDLFHNIEFGSVYANDSKVVKLTASKEYDENSPTFKPGIKFIITPLYDQTEKGRGGEND